MPRGGRGHILPGVAIAKILRERGHRVHFVVKKDRDSQAFLAREGFPSSAFYFEGFPRKVSGRAVLFPLTALAAFFSARRIFRRESPDVFLGMGGYISVPAGLAAVLSDVPIVLHEQNVRAGLANRFLSRWAKTVATSFDSTEGLSARGGRIVCTGLPLRPDLGPKDPAESRRSLGLNAEAFTLLIFGGSQGARGLNAKILDGMKVLAKERPTWQYIHLTGKADEDNVRVAYSALGRNAFVHAFHSDMSTIYSASDFVIARAGANTVMEIRRMGRSALLVPFPFATDDHQLANARVLEKEGTARVVLEKDLTVDTLWTVLRELPSTEKVRASSSERLAQGGPDILNAAQRVADLMTEGGK
ncbi:MAG: UDP-N-acetylglucosamine--N-acetylmuramyl-(pentapeptide) pyrophosphoryl-undecaprenol N-acetylglucosamine transferase [Elusimicrobia bacterium]|nr:UDP-N-acetylglucosamine--N-acetylmuramyl-(pentapeptide) pyrophosphoryl-undecaprenol N-acetylglucosamine transferase [Elusimicrobiota bacterium]